MAKNLQKKEHLVLPVKFRQAEKGADTPEIALYQIGDNGKVAHKIAELSNGCLSIPPDLEDQTMPIALGPNVENLGTLETKQLVQFYPKQSIAGWRKRGVLEIARANWKDWFFYTRCVSGKLSKCFWFANQSTNLVSPRLDIATSLQSIRPIDQIVVLPPFRFKCIPVCYGIVEVYRRVCCCNPWTIIPKLKKRIPEILREIPNLGPPAPGPLSLLTAKASKNINYYASKIEPAKGVVREQRVIDDLQALQELTKPQEQYDFLIAKHYLISIICGPYYCTSHKIGETSLGPDGSFKFCFFPHFKKWNCYVTYYYRVRQFNGSHDIYIYDGATSHSYFSASEFADLKTYHPQVATCEVIDPPIPDQDQPIVMLQRIGSTDTHQLKSPAQNTTSGINSSLSINDGLIDQGYATNCPLAKRLNLLLYIDPRMATVGAKYYRFSIVKANDLGNPTGSGYQVLRNGVSWRRFKPGTFNEIEGIGLGPKVINKIEGLYEIPYLTLTNRWLANQFHYQLDTEEYLNGRYLVRIEIFDSVGNKIRPQGSTGSGIEKGFRFLKWTGPTTTSTVNYDSLIHLMHFDNLVCAGDITDVRKNGTASVDTCQFLIGTALDQFSLGFRAYHENDFMLNYILHYVKGLGNSPVLLDSGNTNQPVSKDGGPPAVSKTTTFNSMLGADTSDIPDTKCSFALELRVHAKHTNGHSRILSYDYKEEAALAIEIA